MDSCFPSVLYWHAKWVSHKRLLEQTIILNMFSCKRVKHARNLSQYPLVMTYALMPCAGDPGSVFSELIRSMVVLFDLLLHAVPPFHYWNALFKFYFCRRFFFPSSKGESEESIQILAVICVLLLWLASRPSFDISPLQHIRSCHHIFLINRNERPPTQVCQLS